MSNSDAPLLYEAVDRFVDAPTGENRENLIETADEYRESWIIQQSSGNVPNRARRHTSKESTTTYDRRLEVERLLDDIPVKLALQERWSATEDQKWWTLSWRTKYSPGGPNRRFYQTKDGSWQIPAEIALDMINEMESLGGLDRKYFDDRRRPIFKTVASNELESEERRIQFEGITGPDEDSGEDPYFVINFDPHAQWKKVMIVDRRTNMATFRSITENPDYMPKKMLRPGSNWWLDNSMMDANVQQMSEFHARLKEYLAEFKSS